MTLHEKWMEKLVDHYEYCDQHYPDSVWCTMMYGSQNYGLGTEESDVDTKSMLIPSLRDVVLGKPQVSLDLQLPDQSLSNVKDFRLMFKNYLKGNINFVETLYTEYYLVHPAYTDFFDELRAHRDLIAHSQPLKLLHMACGMAHQKFVAMEKRFESKIPLIEKYGYDPKQLHHLERLRIFIFTFKHTMNFQQALDSGKMHADYLLPLKLEPMPLEEARKLAAQSIAMIDEMVDRAAAQLPEAFCRKEAEEFLDDLTVRMFASAMAVQAMNRKDFRKEWYAFAKKIFVV